MFCHGTQNIVQPLLRSRKLHIEVMSWISGTYMCHYAWPLPETNLTTVRDLIVPSVSSLSLSVMVCSCHVCINLSHLRSRLLSCRCCTLCSFSTGTNLKCVIPSVFTRSIKIFIWPHVSKHIYTQVLQCTPSSTSVGLAQARPKYYVTNLPVLLFLQ